MKTNNKFIDAVAAGIKAALENYHKPDSFKKGEEFEDYIRQYLFPAMRYKLLHKTANYTQNRKDFVESSKEPDFLFECTRSGRRFYIESKFRSNLMEGKLEICSTLAQLNRYKEINTRTPVFICAGIHGSPTNPEYISVIPVKHIKYTGLFPSVFEPFLVEPRELVTSEELWDVLKMRF